MTLKGYNPNRARTGQFTSSGGNQARAAAKAAASVARGASRSTAKARTASARTSARSVSAVTPTRRSRAPGAPADHVVRDHSYSLNGVARGTTLKAKWNVNRGGKTIVRRGQTVNVGTSMNAGSRGIEASVTTHGARGKTHHGVSLGHFERSTPVSGRKFKRPSVVSDKRGVRNVTARRSSDALSPKLKPQPSHGNHSPMIGGRSPVGIGQGMIGTRSGASGATKNSFVQRRAAAQAGSIRSSLAAQSAHRAPPASLQRRIALVSSLSNTGTRRPSSSGYKPSRPANVRTTMRKLKA